MHYLLLEEQIAVGRDAPFVIGGANYSWKTDYVLVFDGGEIYRVSSCVIFNCDDSPSFSRLDEADFSHLYAFSNDHVFFRYPEILQIQH